MQSSWGKWKKLAKIIDNELLALEVDPITI
jgi:hypothetical protein